MSHRKPDAHWRMLVESCYLSDERSPGGDYQTLAFRRAESRALMRPVLRIAP